MILVVRHDRGLMLYWQRALYSVLTETREEGMVTLVGDTGRVVSVALARSQYSEPLQT
jgi:ABC-type phosphate transport system auxiliary subunit